MATGNSMTAVVVPTIREECIKLFLEKWEPQFHREDVRVIVVEDHGDRRFTLPDWVTHKTQLDVLEDLGDKASCIATQAGACESYGVWLAAQMGAGMTICLDDDCLPPVGGMETEDFVGDAWKSLESMAYHTWVNPYESFYPRGFPYGMRTGVKTMLHAGTWQNIPDIDAPTQMLFPNLGCKANDTQVARRISRGVYFAMSAMNVAFRREAAPLMYFWKLPDGMKRWGDVWCGVIFKKIADAQCWGVSAGPPAVWHDRASNVWANLRQEVDGYEINETLWQTVDNADIYGLSPLEAYRRIAMNIGVTYPELREVAVHMLTWASLWEAKDG